MITSTSTSNAPRAHNAPKSASGAFSVQRGMDVPEALKTWLDKNVSQETSVVHIRDAINEAFLTKFSIREHVAIAEAIEDFLAELKISLNKKGLKALEEALTLLRDHGSVEQKGFVFIIVTWELFREERLKALEEALTLLRDHGSDVSRDLFEILLGNGMASAIDAEIDAMINAVINKKRFMKSIQSDPILSSERSVQIGSIAEDFLDFEKKTLEILINLPESECEAIIKGYAFHS